MGENYIKKGWLKGGKVSVPVTMGASEVLLATSGGFVLGDGSGRFQIATAAATTIAGYVEHSGETTSATEGETQLNMIVDPSAIFRIPINSGTLTRTMVGQTCDLSVSSNVQGAALDASSRDIIRIVDGDFTNNGYVDVMFVDAKRDIAGVV